VQRLKKVNVDLVQERTTSKDKLVQLFIKLGVNSLAKAMMEVDKIGRVLESIDQTLRITIITAQLKKQVIKT